MYMKSGHRKSGRELLQTDSGVHSPGMQLALVTLDWRASALLTDLQVLASVTSAIGFKILSNVTLVFKGRMLGCTAQAVAGVQFFILYMSVQWEQLNAEFLLIFVKVNSKSGLFPMT